MTFPLPNFHTYISSTIDKIFRYKWTVIMANEVSMTLQKEWKLVEKDCSFLAFNICTSYHTFRVWMIFTGCLCLTWLNYAGKNLSYDLIKRLSLFQFNFPNKMFLPESTWRVPERRSIRMCNMAARQAASHWPLYRCDESLGKQVGLVTPAYYLSKYFRDRGQI